MRVGFSYWGFCEKFSDCNVANTPDGHRYGRPVFVDEILSRGHQVYALQEKRESFAYPGILYAHDRFPEVDVVFMEWRWPTYKNSGDKKFEPDLDRQTALLDYYHDKVPIVVWDTDLKLTKEDEERWPNMIVADPTFNPYQLSIPRVRLTFWSDFVPLLPPHDDPIEFGYVGNNYEREAMFLKYYSKPSQLLRGDGIQTKVWGNWLQRSPERESPEELIGTHPYVAFSDRVSFKESMSILNRFICTVHITKPGYAKQGFASPRYLENIITNTPALVPAEFCVPNLLGNHWTVNTPEDVAKRVYELKSLSARGREQVVNEQRDALLKVHDFRVESVIDFIEGLSVDPVNAVRTMG